MKSAEERVAEPSESEGRSGRLGIDPDYVDATGKRRRAPAHVLDALERLLSEGAAGNFGAEAERPPEVVRAYQGPPGMGRVWVLVVQLYSVRSGRNWGHGDFTDLLLLIDKAAELGAAGIGLNPLHALFEERPDEPSPYAPSSRDWLNPLYVDLEAVPEFPREALVELADDLAAARKGRLVDYARVAAMKRRAFEAAFANFQRIATAERRSAFEAFQRERAPDVERFAAFEILRSRYGKPFWEWPEDWRSPDEAHIQEMRAKHHREMLLVEFQQWLCHTQLAACRERAEARGLPIGLYLDIAVGVRSDGFDAWNEPAILRGASIGAPPDPLNTAGQKWGLAGFNPFALRRTGFSAYRRMLASSMRYGGAVRLDHVLGLKRLYLIPGDASPTEGAYLRMPFEELLSATAEESRANRCIVIGEDLGTVPEGFRATMAAWGIWSYQVVLFARDEAGIFADPETYPENALVTISTHDLATFAGWVSGQDISVKQKLGLDPGERAEDRKVAVKQLRLRLGIDSIALPEILKWVATSPCRVMAVAAEDVLGVADQVNVPGTVDEHPNWRRRLPKKLKQWLRSPGMLAVAEALRPERSWASVKPPVKASRRSRRA